MSEPSHHPSLPARVAQLEAIVRQLTERDKEGKRAREIISGSGVVHQLDQSQQPQQRPRHRRENRHLRVVKGLLIAATAGGLWATVRKLVTASATVAVGAAAVVAVARVTPYTTAAPPKHSLPGRTAAGLGPIGAVCCAAAHRRRRRDPDWRADLAAAHAIPLHARPAAAPTPTAEASPSATTPAPLPTPVPAPSITQTVPPPGPSPTGTTPGPCCTPPPGATCTPTDSPPAT